MLYCFVSLRPRSNGSSALCQLLDELLVLVQLLQVVCVHARNVAGVGLVAVLLVTEHAHLHLGLGHVLQSEK